MLPGRSTVVIGVIAGTLTALLGAAPSATALPVGNADGVAVKRSPNGVVFSFRKAATRRFRVIAGRRIRVTCVRLPPRQLGLEFTDTQSEDLRAPRRRRPFRASAIRAQRSDYCEVTRRRFKRKRRRSTETVGPRLVASVPLTQKGAVHLDERERALELSDFLTGVGALADERRQHTYPTSAEIQGRLPDEVVALTTPAGTPPPGRIGYYSDGALHVVAVSVSAQGRRLYIERDGDRLATNLIQYLND